MSNTTKRKITFLSLLKYWYVLVCIGIICSISVSTAKADSTVSAVVGPRISDFQFNFTSQDSGSVFPKDQILTYTLVYGASSSAAFATHNTITADFNSDTINGTHVLDYVTGSATNAYNNTPPIVDLVNHKITWTIDSLPAGVIDQEISFQLKINENYQGTNYINYSVKTYMTNQYVSIPEQVIYQSFNPNLTPTPAPTSPTTPTPTPIVVATPTFQVTQQTSITNVYFNSIADTSSGISVSTSEPTKLSIFYGTSPNNLTSSFATGDYSPFTKILLPDLTPNTLYYIQVSAINENGDKVRSEFFTFKTAPVPPETIQTPTTTLISSDGNLLTTITATPTQHLSNQITLPNSSAYEVTYSISPTTKIKNIELILRNKNVLGINTYAYAQESNIVDVAMVERQPGVYYAKFQPILLSGDYEVYIRVTEEKGNIYEQKITDILVRLPLTIIEKVTNRLLPDVRAYFYFYNTYTKQYEPITSAFGTIKNPDFSDIFGHIPTTLPNGKYKVVVSNLFHSTNTAYFSIGNNSSYPTIYLVKRPWDISSVITYFSNILFDVSTGVNASILSLSATVRNFNILAIGIVTISICIAFLLFALKTGTKITTLPIHLFHVLHHTFLPFQKQIFFGHIFSPNGIPIPSVDVFALSEDGKVLFHTVSNTQGGFSYKRQKESVVFRFMHEGYEQTDIAITEDMDTKIILSESASSPLRNRPFLILLGEFFGFSFEGILALSLLLEIAFMIHFGILFALPFFLLSLCNMLLWIFYLREAR